MRARWGLAAAAAAALAASARAGETCELHAIDRASTPSSACMRCHDGSRGLRVPFEMKADGSGMSHPVDLDYDQAAARQPERYQPAASLPADVPLVNGKLECTTCHDGRLSTPMHVVEQPRLCYACHRVGD